MKQPRLSSPFALLLIGLFSCGQKTNTENNNLSLDTMKYKQGTISMNSGYAHVNGIKMYYEIYGQGRPLVLLHGGGSTIQTTFSRIIPALAKHRQIIAVELQAHGRTEDRETPSSFKQDADDVAALLKNLNISKADIFGFSNGGHTTMQIAISYPEIVNKAIVGSAFYKRSGAPAGFWKAMENAKFSDMPQVFKDEFLKINNDTTALLRMFKRDATRMQTFKDWNEKDIKSITAPTLLIAGDHDLVYTEHLVAMSHLIPNSTLVILPGGHGDYIGEITTLTNGQWTQEYTTALIEQFLDSTSNK
jgi:pimeloyl-ACP methyl ester carboxylesterase